MGYATPASVVRKDGSKIRGWGFMKCQMEDVRPGSFNIKERVRYMTSAESGKTIIPIFSALADSGLRNWTKTSA